MSSWVYIFDIAVAIALALTLLMFKVRTGLEGAKALARWLRNVGNAVSAVLIILGIAMIFSAYAFPYRETVPVTYEYPAYLVGKTYAYIHPPETHVQGYPIRVLSDVDMLRMTVQETAWAIVETVNGNYVLFGLALVLAGLIVGWIRLYRANNRLYGVE